MVEINQKGLQGLNHTQVVQLLKDCPVGTEATLVIQRAATAGGQSYTSPILKRKMVRRFCSPLKFVLLT